MKIALNTNINLTNQKSNNCAIKQNNPNFARRTPVFMFPEEIRLIPAQGPINKFSQTLWSTICKFVKDNNLGTPVEGRTPSHVFDNKLRFVKCKTPSRLLSVSIEAELGAEEAIAAELNRLGVKFVRVPFD